MDGRKKQRKKIPDRSGNFKYKDVLDRKEQHREDFVDWQLFLTYDEKIEAFVKTCSTIRKAIGNPVLNPNTDLMGSNYGYGPFMPKNWNLGVASQYLWDHPELEEVLHKLIYNNVLVPQGWSYNFYPIVEYIILYKDVPKDTFFANPCLFELFKHNPNELLRVKISTSDINFLRERVRLFFVKNTKATKDQASKLEEANNIIDILTLRRKHLPKNVAFKICAFRVFQNMGNVKAGERIIEGDFDSNNFLKNQIEEFRNEYERWKNSGLPFQKKVPDKTIHNALKKLHGEYLELLTK
jgi:hypothetical protein